MHNYQDFKTGVLILRRRSGTSRRTAQLYTTGSEGLKNAEKYIDKHFKTK
jgi:hypothetical protein